MKTIRLTKGKFAIVDDADYEWLSKQKWHFAANAYAARRAWNPNRIVYMHRELLNAPPAMDVDHINGNGVDNRRANLRVCTHVENLHNAKRPHNNTSGVKGVHWDNYYKKWVAKIKFKGNRIYIGSFDDLLQAQNARRQKEIELYAELENKPAPKPSRHE